MKECLYSIVLKMIDEEMPIRLAWPCWAENTDDVSREIQFRKVYTLLPAEQIERVIVESLTPLEHEAINFLWGIDKHSKPVIRSAARCLQIF